MRALLVPLLGFVLVLLGCGGSDSSSTGTGTSTTTGSGEGGPCPTLLVECGDVVGTWAPATNCNATTEQCTGTTSSLEGTVTGTVTFNSDNTFSSSVSVDATDLIKEPTSCLTFAPRSLAAGYDANTTLGGVSIQQTCTGDSSQSCSCTAEIHGAVTQTGTYMVEGADVSMIETGGGQSGLSCVSGGELKSNGLGGTGEPSNYDTLFARQ